MLEKSLIIDSVLGFDQAFLSTITSGLATTLPNDLLSLIGSGDLNTKVKVCASFIKTDQLQISSISYNPLQSKILVVGSVLVNANGVFTDPIQNNPNLLTPECIVYADHGRDTWFDFVSSLQSVKYPE